MWGGRDIEYVVAEVLKGMTAIRQSCFRLLEDANDSVMVKTPELLIPSYECFYGK